jgi:hypothetical protein
MGVSENKWHFVREAVGVMGAVAVCAWSAPASATLLFSDGFSPRVPDTGTYNYRVGEYLAYTPDPDLNSNPNGQYNRDYDRYWRRGQGATNTAANAMQLVAGDLTYPGLPGTAPGNKAIYSLTSSNNPMARVAIKSDETSMASGETWYWSGILHVDNIATLNASVTTASHAGSAGIILGGFSAGVGPSPTGTSITTFSGHLALAKNGDNTSQYFLSSGVTNNGKAWAINKPLSQGQDVLVVVSEFVGTQLSEDVVSMWVNPDLTGASPPTADAVSTVTTGTRTVPASFLLRDSAPATTGGTPTIYFDQLRVATTWSDVIPEPGSLGILALGAVGLVHPRRRPARAK